MSITESESNFNNLENLSIGELLQGINQEDQSVAHSVQKALPQIEKALGAIVEKMKVGGRLFYIGAGTSGRLGILDASECPPTFGVGFDKVIGLIAGGDHAIRKAVEFAEDDRTQAWNDLQEYNISEKDFLIGIAASGRTPYVIGGLKMAQGNGISTACITCNPDSEVVEVSDFPIEVPVGPEFVTGSTRMKAGTAQKMVLNMISTTAMIQRGHVKGNKMVDMQLSNDKLVDRGTKMIMHELGIEYEAANKLLMEHGSVRKAVEAGKG
ncbi:N-acetylmuramic acid 6-phosphate etherase [Marivirga sp.]|uniref:N-acetylmuramic acid 6-phosphate etherase n=1 Tax=Marivirga sp. TaxID=2018662 RepID=UPI0025D557FA|nr:N-acetylmuramic acid 6-phosphate etherase [Marivirga sp.]